MAEYRCIHIVAKVIASRCLNNTGSMEIVRTHTDKGRT